PDGPLGGGVERRLPRQEENIAGANGGTVSELRVPLPSRVDRDRWVAARDEVDLHERTGMGESLHDDAGSARIHRAEMLATYLSGLSEARQRVRGDEVGGVRHSVHP